MFLEVFDEMKVLFKGFKCILDIFGMSYDFIEESRGIQWLYCEGMEGGKGDLCLYIDGVFQYFDGKVKLIVLLFIDNNE